MMNQTSDPENSSFTQQIRRVVEDAIDYVKSQLRVLQTEAASMALSTVVFIVIIAFAALAGVIAFILLSVAFGIWLTHVTGGALWSVLIIGGIYALMAVGLAGYAARWLKNLKS